MATAISALKALAKNEKATDLADVTTLGDPSLNGAKRVKNAVELNPDPEIEESAAKAAILKAELDKKDAEYKILQAVLRDYGAKKRVLFNRVYKTDVTTVSVPYRVEVPIDPNSETPGVETQRVQVICTNKYTVAQDSVKELKPSLGANYGRLFVEETEKVLKSDGEAMIRKVFEELGLSPNEVDSVMGQFFDVTVTVKAADSYEKEFNKLPENVQDVLNHSVTRVQPAIKFPK